MKSTKDIVEISIISPVYMGENTIEEMVNRIDSSMDFLSVEYEIILVEDHSPDNSWEAITKVCINNKRVKGIKLSKNFGQHSAISAGLLFASGAWVVVMDCDLQDRPEEIVNLYNQANLGYDIVYAQRLVRQDSLIKKLSSKVFYSVFSYLTNTKQDPSIANFGIYSRDVINAVISMGDYIKFFPTMVQWVGFKSTKIEVAHAKRNVGKSSYSWKKLIKLAFDSIISFSDKPLKVMVSFGIIMSITSFLLGLLYLILYFVGEIEVLGFTSLILTITHLSGLIILMLGLVGVYVGKTFEQTKKRPVYIIKEKVNI